MKLIVVRRGKKERDESNGEINSRIWEKRK